MFRFRFGESYPLFAVRMLWLVGFAASPLPLAILHVSVPMKLHVQDMKLVLNRSSRYLAMKEKLSKEI